MSLIHNATFNSQTRVLSLLDKAGNVISSCEVPSKELVDDITKPLTFRATQNGSTVTLTKSGTISGSFQTSSDGGNTWVDYTLNTAITLNIDDEVSFRTRADRTPQNTAYYFYFEMTGKIEAWHNVVSMLRTNDFATYSYVFRDAVRYLFRGCTSLVKAPVLPSTTIDSSCYENMFEGCTSLKEAPALPATKLAWYCYRSMFSGCTSLVKAPALPAIKLARHCYASMFDGCTSLKEAPALPATTLDEYCYYCMFQGCRSLVNAPELPATTLKGFCYMRMFWQCYSLTKSPELTATTLDNSCYENMFESCSRLKEVRCQMPTTISAEDIPTYTGTGANAWLSGVSSTGTFYTNADANWPSGASGIPTGWTRVNEGAPTVDDPNKPLMLRAIEDGSSVTLRKYGTLSNTYQTSTNGTDWTDYTFGTKISLNKGESVYFRCSNHPTTQTGSNYVRFYMFGKIEAWHNAYSMISSSFTDTSASVGSYGMYLLFHICEVLTKAPLLLNALAEHCYDGMFFSCIALKQAPSLPATTLADGCYNGMFSYCLALKQAPSLPATTLADGCYKGMFSHCSNLKEVRISATTTAPNALNNWLKDVSATGDFYCDPNATIFPSGASGIPANWTRHALADYPATP